ncbi:MAG: right-handed parallel beta-helix repeat-containing protein [Nanoarchaeota archaeon]|nr:right-handed parallel beta-helix repeat-containing protein [Nanoarchaeota archaeon]
MRIQINHLFICIFLAFFTLTGIVTSEEHSNETNELLLTECGSLNIEGATYELQNDITTTGDCFTIEANSITLNLNGHSINGEGPDIRSGDGVVIKRDYTNIIIQNGKIYNFRTGILLWYSDNNEIKNNEIKSNWKAIALSGSNGNIINNNLIEDSTFGIDFKDSSNSNTIHSNKLLNNKETIEFDQNGGVIENNLFYNNLFSSDRRKVDFNLLPAYGSNQWSVSKMAEENIIGGEYIGGNYWEMEDGSGFSQNCRDSEKDGLCDLEYKIYWDNIDYFPLTNSLFDNDPPEINLIFPEDNYTNKKNRSTNTIKFKFSISDESEIDFCLFVINGVDSTRIENFGKEYTMFLDFEKGSFNWNVICIDERGNRGVSEFRDVKVEEIISNKTSYLDDEKFFKDSQIFFTEPKPSNMEDINNSEKKETKIYSRIIENIIDWFKNLFSQQSPLENST